MDSLDSKEESHDPVSPQATFNNFFPEEDRSRAERFQELVQVGKERQVHPAARGLVAATGVARYEHVLQLIILTCMGTAPPTTN